MIRRMLGLASWLVPLSLTGVAAAIPPLASAPEPHAAPAGAAAAAPSPATDVRRGIVTVEREGRVLGFGTVLSGDGRILTALSALTGGEQADVRYADNHVARARVGHRDKEWDLALLIPLSGKWTEGLRASEADPAASDLKVIVNGGGKPSPVATKLKSKVDAHAKEGAALPSALDVELRGAPAAGAPIVDANGTVLGILVRACKPGDPAACAPGYFGAPVASIRNFLVHTPMNAVQPSPWLGIVGNPDASGSTRGVRVMQVAPASPAEKAGLKAQTHLIVAVDGRPVDSPEHLAEQISKHAVGESVKLLVLENEKLREITVILRAHEQ